MVVSATPSDAKLFVLPQRQDSIQAPLAQTVPLNKIRTKLDMTLLALKVLIGINSESIVQLASKLNLPPQIVDELALVVREDQGETQVVSQNQSLKVETAQSLILVICHLAKQHQALIRRGVALMEQMGTQKGKPESVTLLREYICNFQKAYQNYYCNDESITSDKSEKLAQKLLVDLLFYSGPKGCLL